GDRLAFLPDAPARRTRARVGSARSSARPSARRRVIGVRPSLARRDRGGAWYRRPRLPATDAALRTERREADRWIPLSFATRPVAPARDGPVRSRGDPSGGEGAAVAVRR